MNINTPLYITGVTPAGDFLLGGIFQMHDRHGFPVDCSVEELKRYEGHQIDWLEALSDCWLNDCLKYDSFVRQASNSTNNDGLHAMWADTMMITLNMFPKMLNTFNPIDTACRYWLSRKRKHLRK